MFTLALLMAEKVSVVFLSRNSFIHSNGPILNITNVTRDDIGNYTCEATNGEGTTVANVYLDVQCECFSVTCYFV